MSIGDFMENSLYKTIKEAENRGAVIITTVEAFHKESRMLYDYLRQAANHGVTVYFSPIETTDQSPPYTPNQSSRNEEI